MGMSSRKKRIYNKTRRRPTIIINKNVEKKTIVDKIRNNPVYVILVLLMFIYNFKGVLSECYYKIFPPAFVSSEMDGNYRGEFLKASSAIVKDSLVFVLGSSKNKAGLRYPAYEWSKRSRESRTCFVPATMLNLFEENCPLSFRFDTDGRILFTADILSRGLQYSLWINDNSINNSFVLDDNSLFSFNGDEYGIELLDKDRTVLFSADYVPPNEIYIQGAFYNNKRYVVFQNSKMSTYPADLTHEGKDFLNNQLKLIPQIFDYSSNEYEGKRLPFNSD